VPPERVRDDLTRLADRRRCVHDFSLQAARIIGRAVPFDGVCVLTMDPATRIPTGEVVDGGLPDEARARMAEIEMRGTDVNAFAGLARARRSAATLSDATGGELHRSLRHRELRAPNGFGDELRAALVHGGTVWGALTLLRASERAPFTPSETTLVASVTAQLADGLRRALLGTTVIDPPVDEEPSGGVAVLAADNAVVAADDSAQRWLAELDGDGAVTRLPPVVAAVAGRARMRSPTSCPGSPSQARVRTASGHWLVVRASRLGEEPDAEVAVVLEPARALQLAPLIADAHDLTQRERVITQHVAHGLMTDEIAARLYISPFTVEDHLKSIFRKVGVHTRGELVARIFLEPDAPPLTDADALDLGSFTAPGGQPRTAGSGAGRSGVGGRAAAAPRRLR
jgi:DNA-binding CsgD family transcriptional regulator